MAINWAPWFDVPMHRRLEVLSLAFFLFSAVALGPIATITMLYLLIFGSVYSKLICLVYIMFVCYDRNCGDRGGRGAGVQWMRSLIPWKHCANYFPLDLVKTADLTADRNYLICIFPHGILCVGAAVNFATNYTKWFTLFPGIRPKLTTLRMNTLLPVQREIFLSCGVVTASEKSLKTLLNQSNDPNYRKNHDGYTSNGVGLIVGGVRETYYTKPNTYRCVIAKRRGFVRIALETGASLVPALSFGENNIYRHIEMKSGFFRRLFEKMMRKSENVEPFFCCGRGLLQYDFGILPLRHPVTTVIGEPIHLDRIENPNEAESDRVHDLFCNRLKEMFELHKSKYVPNHEQVHLELV